MASVTTATDVAEMYERLQDAENALDVANQKILILTQERETLQARLTISSRERDDELVRATSLSVILEAASMALVQGLTKMNDEARARRQLRRDAQEHELGVSMQRVAPPRQSAQEHGDDGGHAQYAPRIVERPQPRPAAVNGPETLDDAPVFLRRPGQHYGTSTTDHIDDDRLPRVTMSDEENLLAVADAIGAR